ncbi:MAG: hypothetical protein HUJ25_12415 [Crocinitomicaceae bacterium]|nr:hypothetical protein [Crocinitomicaceae bacterium]
MRIKGGMLITPKDIQLITGTNCANTARREHRTVRDAFGITTTRLSIKMYCEYWQLDYEETVEFLNTNR